MAVSSCPFVDVTFPDDNDCILSRRGRKGGVRRVHAQKYRDYRGVNLVRTGAGESILRPLKIFGNSKASTMLTKSIKEAKARFIVLALDLVA